MHRHKIFFYFIFILIAQNAIAQLPEPADTVTFEITRDVSTYKVRCFAQKVNVDVITGDSIFENFNISDTVNGAYTFNWGGDIEPNIDGLPRSDYEFALQGTYTINLSVSEDSTGKTFVDSKVFPIRDIVRIPNVFTPNGDGINDLFIVRANGIDEIDMTIFNQAGTQVFTLKSPIIIWDGRNASGTKVNPGIYFYVLASKSPNIEPQTGFVNIFYELKDKNN